MILFSLLLLAACDPIEHTTVLRDYCEQYRRLVLAPADASELQKLPRPLKARLVANETTYRCACTAFKNPVCQNDADKK